MANPALPKTQADPWHDLPPVDTIRWAASRKNALVEACADEKRPEITEEAICARYEISGDEFQQWKRLVAGGGEAALRITALQQYRR